MYVQPHFEEFHEAIKLSLEENRTLREKRDIICGKIRDRVPRIFEADGCECPPFEILDQGSYQMRTGTYPLNGDFDIDLGLYFEIDHVEYDPVGLKRLVHSALVGHTKEVRIRRACVTVQYQHAGEPAYHVDIAIYADGSHTRDGLPRLAVGKERSGEDFCGWEISDSRALRTTVLGSYRGDQLRQFRRMVRYLKRWKDVRFPAGGNDAPRGIALTVACHEHFEWQSFGDGSPDDLVALMNVVEGMLDAFTVRPQRWPSHDIQIILPVEPYSNLCERMTPRHMKRFHDELENLLDVLDLVRRGRSEEKACKRLRRVFGEAFPMPFG